MEVLEIFLLFNISSFFGWAWEVIISLLQTGKFVNRGFLNGPICPIYGFGTIFLFELVVKLEKFSITYYRWEIAIIGAIGSALLEYATSYVLEYKFNKRWWDYSNIPLNLNGRVCVAGAVIFGIMAVLIVFEFVPTYRKIFTIMSKRFVCFISLVLMAVLSIDVTTTMYQLNKFK